MDGLQIFDFEQNTPEWYEARRGIVTASNFQCVMAKGRGGADSKTRSKYLYTLAAEIITGACQPGYKNADMDRGHAFEDDARQHYAFEREVQVTRIGFMRRGRAGCSPDGLVGSDGITEIKSKEPHLHFDVLEQNRLPPEHVRQVQGQLWVSGRDWCDFVSYWPRLPLFVKRVERDEKYIETLAQAVADFVGELDALVAKYGNPIELERAA